MRCLLFAALSLSGLAGAAAMDIPLAVTGLAHPSLKQTPTADELKLSDDYLKSGLELLKKSDKAGRAVEDFMDSVRLAPRAENYKALGTAYYQMGNKVKAAWAYRQSLQLAPDKQVQALVDALEGRDHPEESFRDHYDELRYGKLLESAAKAEKAGQRDSALRDYVDAFQLHDAPAARRPALRLAAALVDDYLASQAAAKAVGILLQVKGLRERAKDLGPQELAELKRLEAAEDRVVALTGRRLREHQKAMLSDREGWEREVTETVAKKVRDVNLNAPSPGR